MVGRKGGQAPPSDSVKDEDSGAFYNSSKDRFSFNSSDFGNNQLPNGGGSIFINFLTDVLS